MTFSSLPTTNPREIAPAPGRASGSRVPVRVPDCAPTRTATRCPHLPKAPGLGVVARLLRGVRANRLVMRSLVRGDNVLALRVAPQIAAEVATVPVRILHVGGSGMPSEEDLQDQTCERQVQAMRPFVVGRSISLRRRNRHR